MGRNLLYDLQLFPLLYSKAVQNKVEGILVSILGKKAREMALVGGIKMVWIWVRKVYARESVLSTLSEDKWLYNLLSL